MISLKKKTAFLAHYSSYDYLVMLFGLTSAPAMFQAEMNHIVCSLFDECGVVYLDDIPIYSKTIKRRGVQSSSILKPKKMPDSSSQQLFACMGSRQQPFRTETRDSPATSGGTCRTSSEHGYYSHPQVTLKLTAGLSKPIGQWNS
ncbi:hypothetical protein CLOP_g10127 [Closterium sp. NIES-67]|nr:hypothetical protein CLOP_g10127 [Closterium sp. NIES-67]